MVSYEERVKELEKLHKIGFALKKEVVKGLKEEIEKGCGEEMEIENYFNIEGNIKTVKCGEEDYLCDCCQNLIKRLNKIKENEE